VGFLFVNQCTGLPFLRVAICIGNHILFDFLLKFLLIEKLGLFNFLDCNCFDWDMAPLLVDLAKIEIF
jgi:hypothetical protein